MFIEKREVSAIIGCVFEIVAEVEGTPTHATDWDIVNKTLLRIARCGSSVTPTDGLRGILLRDVCSSILVEHFNCKVSRTRVDAEKYFGVLQEAVAENLYQVLLRVEKEHAGAVGEKLAHRFQEILRGFTVRMAKDLN